MNIQELVRFHRNRWIANGDYGMPDITDCLDFMTTEIAEAIDKRLRLDPKYIRNNHKDVTIRDLATEIFDCMMMGCTALDILGYDLFDIAKEKLARMDAKRGICTDDTV